MPRGATVWTPAQLANLLHWGKADAGITVVGGVVTAIADQSSNGNNLSQATALKQPTVVAGYRNSLPALFFQTSIGQQFLMGTFTNGPTTGLVMSQFSIFQPVAANTCLLQDYGDAVGLAGMDLAFISSRAVRSTLFPAQTVSLEGGFYGLNKWHLVVAVFDGLIMRLYLDGKYLGSQSNGGPFNCSQVFSLGTFEGPNGGLASMNGYIGEWGVTTGVMADQELANLRAYSQRRWLTP